MEKAFEILSWDSDFFNFKVARIKDDVNIADELILKDLSDNDINLAYYSSPTQLPHLENHFYTINNVDQKLTYSKEISPHRNNNNIISYDKQYPEKQLIDLAISSGIYSRFNTDKRIGRQNFEALYTQWITKSVSGEIADEVLVYEEEDKIQGFVTIGKKNSRADIGIIAVDAAFRGKGIGKELMFRAENYYYNQSEIIQVVTQGNNLPACKLYESCGYTIEKTEYFYHLWKRTN